MKTDNPELEYLKSLKILYVEDNKTTQLLYGAIFEEIVAEIIYCDNGEEGYQIFLNKEIDIIVTDYQMPIMNGLEMSKKIRESDKEIPIIFVSALEELNVMAEAIKLGINHFVKKPIKNDEIIESMISVSKIFLANRYIEGQKTKKLQELQKKEQYSSYQEDLAFAKELNILRNDFYYQLIDYSHISLVDFLYQPLDVISGDAYSARRIDEHRTFYLIVDGMGKGLSASLTAMIMTSFVNHIIDKMIEYDSFSLNILIKESMDYIKPILLDEESIAIEYILFDGSYDMLSYAKFAMPVTLMQDRDGNIIRLKSNNPPLSKWQASFDVKEYNISKIDKFLFYSDGIVENTAKDETKVYADYIEEDFKHSFTREDLKRKFFEKIDEVEDDLTIIFINRLPLEKNLVMLQEFTSTLEDVDNASEWYSELWNEFTDDVKISYEAGVVFTELYMNAYEHGNLGINSYEKHQLLDNDTYFETLKARGSECKKLIKVQVHKIIYESVTYIITQISDEGEGFDTQILSEIFRNSAKFNGRGVFVSRKNSLGIYYNVKGNSVLYLNKI